MKKYLFLATFVGGISLTQVGEGFNVSEALMDACNVLAKSGEFPENDIEDVELITEIV